MAILSAAKAARCVLVLSLHTAAVQRLHRHADPPVFRSLTLPVVQPAPAQQHRDQVSSLGEQFSGWSIILIDRPEDPKGPL